MHDYSFFFNSLYIVSGMLLPGLLVLVLLLLNHVFCTIFKVIEHFLDTNRQIVSGIKDDGLYVSSTSQPPNKGMITLHLKSTKHDIETSVSIDKGAY